MPLTLIISKHHYTNDLIIATSGNRNGAEKYVKKYVLEIGMQYKEFNPAHTPKNLYSAMSDNYYEKTYHVSQFHHRNMLIARDCDVMMAFIPNGIESNGSLSAIKNAKKLNKPVTIIS